ncbi:MAG: LruC domain-containing protein [Bacteroidales bacterium]|nr:LruC domain-containing protein [Bacteroidales bacterium]
MKPIFIPLLSIASLALSVAGCDDKINTDGPKNSSVQDFTFETVNSDVTVNVQYTSNLGNEIYFEVYDTYPYKTDESGLPVFNSELEPLFAAFTDKTGKYTGEVDLPKYLSTAYLYTPAFYATGIMEGTLSGSTLTFSEATKATYATKSAAGPTSSAYEALVVNGTGVYADCQWKEWLGSYDRYYNGSVESYKYTGTTLVPEDAASLYAAHLNVINVSKSCPEEYRSYKDMYLEKDAEVALTFLGGNTCWNSSLGYYVYKEGEKPASIDAANVVLVFPNTQDGEWVHDARYNYAASATKGVDRLTSVQLMYYPNIASGSKEGATTVFPQGYYIGLVLATNSWANRLDVSFCRGRDQRFRSATSENLSKNGYGHTLSEPRTAVYRYGDDIMISFEDAGDDTNFSDVVVTMKSNPIDAIVPDAVVDPTETTTYTVSVNKGVYAFEDLWPNAGDYDMNDVIAKYAYAKTTDKNNNIYEESFTFKTYANYASLKSGLAAELSRIASTDELKYYVRTSASDEFEEVDGFEKDGSVILFTDDVRSQLNTEYKVTVTHASAVSSETTAKAFIYRNQSNGKRWEVHIVNEAPSSNGDYSYFGTYSDLSDPENGSYYVRAGNYPFAIFMSGATESDIEALIDKRNESRPIDELYTDYTTWVTGKGSTATGWYKKVNN